MRISMIVALARDPPTRIITAEDLPWAIQADPQHRRSCRAGAAASVGRIQRASAPWPFDSTPVNGVYGAAHVAEAIGYRRVDPGA